MRARRLAAVLIASLFVVSGCGGGSSTAQKVKIDATPVGLRHAAETTLAKGTSKVDFTIALSILGTDVNLSGTGAMDPANKRFEMSFDAGDLFDKLSTRSSLPAGVSSSLDKPIDIVVDGTVMYLRFAALAAATGSDKEWTKIDLAAAAQGAGDLLGSSGAGALGADPSSFLQFLKGAGKVTTVGNEDVRGAHTTHFSGSYTLNDALAALPDDQRANVERAFGSLGLRADAATAEIPFDAWVGDDGLVRRVQTTVDPSTFAPAGKPIPSAKTSTPVEFYDFGEPVDIQVPTDDEVQDASSLLPGFSSSFETSGSSISS